MRPLTFCRFIQFSCSKGRQINVRSALLSKIIRNTAWLLAEKGLRTTVGFFVIAITARHLGPEQFGLYSIGVTVVSILASVVPVGLGTLLVQRFTEVPRSVGNTLSTGLAITAVSSAAAWGLVSAVALILLPDGWPVLIVIAISAFARPSDVVRSLFESRMQIRPMMVADGLVLLAFAGIRIVAVSWHLGVVEFAAIYAVESITSALVIVIICRFAEMRDLSEIVVPRRVDLVEMIQSAGPLIAAAAFISVYTKLDQLLVTQLLGLEEAGSYVAASRISESINSIAVAVAAATFPAALAARERGGDAAFDRAIRRILSAACAFAMAAAVIVSLGSGAIIHLVYGDRFADAAQILAIHVWTTVFVMLGTIGSRWYVANGLQRLILTRAIAAGLVSILVNFGLIPTAGTSGAAVAAVISYAAAGYFLDAVWKSTRTLFITKTRAIFHPHMNVAEEVKEFLGRN